MEKLLTPQAWLRLAQLYLYLNALLYAVVAIRSTLAPQRSATNLGYLTLSDRGRAEYLVVYGGLQLSLALMFFILARNPAHIRLGLLLSLGFYAPIVAYRIGAALLHWPVSGSALGTIALETLLLAAAGWLYYTSS